jgi:hypothetical protein
LWDQSPIDGFGSFLIVRPRDLNQSRSTNYENESPKLIILALFAAGSALFAGMGSSNAESLLTAAGFRVRTPETPKQKQIYATLPAYKVERATVNGKVFYVYKDEKKGVAYIGREAEYQRYQQLAVQQQIAQQQYMAAELDRQAALNFDGGFGVRRMWY